MLGNQGELTLRYGLNLSNQGDLLDTLRRLRASNRNKGALWTALQQNKMLIALDRSSE
jgi:hypothetical protein